MERAEPFFFHHPERFQPAALLTSGGQWLLTSRHQPYHLIEENPMFGLDAIALARIQFAFTISFHILFPAINIGLESYLAVL